MTRTFQADRLGIKAFAQQGEAISGSTPLQNMERLAEEAQGLQPESEVNWSAKAELRPHPGGEADVWLNLKADTAVPLTCQRCMHSVLVPVEVNQWYRFVDSEEIAMAEDDQSEEDLLVLEPQFNLLALLEDELLMGLPLVPMHENCPALAPQLQSGIVVPDDEAQRRNSFAALAQLKKNGDLKN
jgi:uncharacterized protein